MRNFIIFLDEATEESELKAPRITETPNYHPLIVGKKGHGSRGMFQKSRIPCVRDNQKPLANIFNIFCLKNYYILFFNFE